MNENDIDDFLDEGDDGSDNGDDDGLSFFPKMQKGRKSEIKLQGLCNMSILPNWSVKYTT